MMLKIFTEPLTGLQVFPIYGRSGLVSGVSMIYLVRDEEKMPDKMVGLEVATADIVKLLSPSMER